MTQIARLKEYLDSGKSITRIQSFNELGICELSSRIGELKEEGYPITGEMVLVKNRWGEECRVKEYKKY